MATNAPRTFRRQIEEKVKSARPVVEFMIEHAEGPAEGEEIGKDQFHATMPTDERLFLLAAMAGDDEASGTAEAAAVMELMRDALPEDEYRLMRSRLKDADDFVSVEMLQDILMWLMEEWSTFPTEPSSTSSVSPPSTGTRSTGRVRGKGSTH